MKITVTVPENTDEEFFDRISLGFKEKYGDDIKIVKRTDSSIIGGFIAEANGTVYDTSIRSKLYEIKKSIKG